MTEENKSRAVLLGMKIASLLQDTLQSTKEANVCFISCCGINMFLTYIFKPIFSLIFNLSYKPNLEMEIQTHI